MPRRRTERRDVLRARISCLVRPWRHRYLLRYQLQFWPKFWKLRQSIRRLKFRIRTLQFGARQSIRGAGDALSILQQLLRIIIWRVGVAVAVVAGLVLAEQTLRERSLLIVQLSPEAQLGFLSTLGQVAATLLALYFTALSVVVSTAYARVPNDIRGLIMREQVGSFYFRALAQFAAVVTVMLSALVFRIPIGALNLGVATALCLFAIFCFTVLGGRAFDYFDPTALLSSISRKLNEAIQLVSAGSHHWRDESFQAHHHREAERLLNSYSNLTAIASQDTNVAGTGLREIGQHIVAVLTNYCERKHSIPSDSYWFTRTYKHKDWLTTSYSEVGIALATGTALQPDAIPDVVWFEDQAARVLADVISALSKRNNCSGMGMLLTNLHEAAQRIGAAFETGAGIRILRVLRPSMLEQLALITVLEEENRDSDRLLERFALVDLHGSVLINLLLGSSAGIRQLTPDTLTEVVGAAQSLGGSAVYSERPLPRKATEELERIQKALMFEASALGSSISPPWFQKEILSRAVVSFLDQTTQSLLNEFETMFGAEAETQLSQKRYAVVAIIAQKGLEACDKLHHAYYLLSKLHQSLQLLDLSKEFKWPAIDWAALHRRIAELRKRLITILANSIGQLAVVETSGRLPDFFGHAYSFLADECFNAALTADDDLFKQLFPRFFAATLAATQRLHKKFIGDQTRAAFAFEPIADVITISGYAFVFAALHGKNALSDVTKYCWDNYLASFTSDEQRRQVFTVLCAAAEPSMAIAPRDMLRTRWEQASRDLLIDKKILPEGRLWSRQSYEASVISHPSPLVRAFADGIDLMTDAQDVFLLNYVFARGDSVGVKKPHDVESFERALSRERKRKQEGLSENDD